MRHNLSVCVAIVLASVGVFLAPGMSAAGEAGTKVRPAGRKAPDYTQFVTVDADGHFVNEHGSFVGYGVNYNQIIDGNRHYGLESYDMGLMDSDLADIAARGFTHVTLRIFWGRYVNEATRANALVKWQQALDLVEAHGLYAIIWYDPMNSWSEEIPSSQRYEVLVRDYVWGLFLDHVRDAATRYKDRKCIIGWRSENEALHINSVTWSSQLPELLARFQAFQSDKYGTIAALNAQWGSAYASFDDVPLPTDNSDPLLMEWNYFREWFIALRNQELAAEIRASAPNHLTLISGIGSVGGPSALFEHQNLDRFTNFNILGNGYYPGDFNDGAFCISHQSIGHYLRTTRPFLSFGFPAMITEVAIWDDPEGVRVSDRQLSDWILSHWIDCVGDGGVGMDIWDNLVIAYRDDVPDPDTVPMIDVEAFTTALSGVDTKFVAPVEPPVLLLRNKATNYSNASPWRDLGNYFALGDWLYQLHVPFDVLSEANIDAAKLENYQVVIVCSQTQLYDDDVWAMFADWLEAESGRVLVAGLYSPQDSHFKPKDPCADMQYLLGLASTTYSLTSHGVGGELVDFVFARDFGELLTDDRITFNMYASSWNIPTPLAVGAEVIAEYGDRPGVPILIGNTLPNGSRVFTFGVPTGFVWWSLTGDLGPVEHDGMVPIYREILAQGGVEPAFDAPTNLGVHIASDASVVLFKERYAEATDAVLTAQLGGALYDVTSCDVAADGMVTLRESIRAHGWLVAKRLDMVLEPASGVTHVESVWVSADGASFSLSGPAMCDVTLSSMTPSVLFSVSVDGFQTQTVSSGQAGVVFFDVPAGTHDVVVERLYESTLRIRVTGIAWSDNGHSATVSFESNEPALRYYTRLYQFPDGYTSTLSTEATFEGLEDGYYMFVATARDLEGNFPPSPCRVWFINRTWGEEFQVYLTDYILYGNAAWMSYAATQPAARYYVRLYDVESSYAGTRATTKSYMSLSEGMHYFVATGKEEGTRAFPPGGPARQFFYTETDGF